MQDTFLQTANFSLPLLMQNQSGKEIIVNEALAKIDYTLNVYQPSIGDYKYSASINNGNGWLKCDGSAISRIVYSELFALIGTSFGVGDGEATFNLPTSSNIQIKSATMFIFAGVAAP